MIYLVDDGTLDTVLECDVCAERMRYDFDARDTDGQIAYPGFITWAIDDAQFNHNCPAEVN